MLLGQVLPACVAGRAATANNYIRIRLFGLGCRIEGA